MKIPKDMVAGTKHLTNSCGVLEITNYVNAKEVSVVFPSTSTKLKVHSSNIRRGEVKDPYAPSCCGVGYIGVGPYTCGKWGNANHAYSVWSGMLERCYTKNSTGFKYYGALGVTVCTEWQNFQTFAKWFEDNYIEGHQLDKDIKVPGNKEYSPTTCIFATPANNSQQALAKEYTFVSPEGKTTKIYNLLKFCRENSLAPAHMHALLRGDRKQHKGWTAPTEEI